LEHGDGVGQRDVGAGDGGGAGAAVGLQDVAVDVDGVLTQLGEVDGGAQRTADQTGDLLGAALDLAGRGLTTHAVVGGGREHGVLGGEPALAGVLLEAGDVVLDAGGAHDPGVAVLDEDGTGRVGGEAAGDAHGAELVEIAAVGTLEIRRHVPQATCGVSELDDLTRVTDLDRAV